MSVQGATSVQNPDAPNYWEQVKHNAAKRKAMASVRRGYAETSIGMLYEPWVADLMDVVRNAARNAGFLTDPAKYQTFRDECAAYMGLPEIAEADHKQLSKDAFDAIEQAATALYGAQKEQ